MPYSNKKKIAKCFTFATGISSSGQYRNENIRQQQEVVVADFREELETFRALIADHIILLKDLEKKFEILKKEYKNCFNCYRALEANYTTQQNKYPVHSEQIPYHYQNEWIALDSVYNEIENLFTIIRDLENFDKTKKISLLCQNYVILYQKITKIIALLKSEPDWLALEDRMPRQEKNNAIIKRIETLNCHLLSCLKDPLGDCLKTLQNDTTTEFSDRIQNYFTLYQISIILGINQHQYDVIEQTYICIAQELDNFSQDVQRTEDMPLLVTHYIHLDSVITQFTEHYHRIFQDEKLHVKTQALLKQKNMLYTTIIQKTLHQINPEADFQEVMYACHRIYDKLSKILPI